MKTFCLLVVLGLASCSVAPTAQTDANACSCSVSAAQVSYSNATSHLASSNAQAAIDELAAKPTEAPIGPRIVRRQVDTPNNGRSDFGAEAACPDELHDIVLGGDCYAGLDARLVQTSINLAGLNDSGGAKARYSCRFAQPTSNTEPANIGVLCLRNAR
jgi:hypothetical protein